MTVSLFKVNPPSKYMTLHETQDTLYMKVTRSAYQRRNTASFTIALYVKTLFTRVDATIGQEPITIL